MKRIERTRQWSARAWIKAEWVAFLAGVRAGELIQNDADSDHDKCLP